jgi:hypothetical protein
MNAKQCVLDGEAGHTACLVIDPVTDDNPRLYADIARLNIGGHHERPNVMARWLGHIFGTRESNGVAASKGYIIRPEVVDIDRL